MSDGQDRSVSVLGEAPLEPAAALLLVVLVHHALRRRPDRRVDAGAAAGLVERLSWLMRRRRRRRAAVVIVVVIVLSIAIAILVGCEVVAGLLVGRVGVEVSLSLSLSLSVLRVHATVAVARAVGAAVLGLGLGCVAAWNSSQPCPMRAWSNARLLEPTVVTARPTRRRLGGVRQAPAVVAAVNGRLERADGVERPLEARAGRVGQVGVG
jgi:ABC-type Fe3+ transport system permease subunit